MSNWETILQHGTALVHDHWLKLVAWGAALPATIVIAALVLTSGCDSSHGQPDNSRPQTKSAATVAPSGGAASKENPGSARTSKPASAPSPSAEPILPNVAAIPAVPRGPYKLPPIDEEQIAAEGIRKVEGGRLTLYTDLPEDAAIDQLPDVFALAVPQWCRYFHIDPSELADWQVRGCLMQDRRRFTAAGLLPGNLEFYHGYTQGSQIWWQQQESDYYRRHLMLHEGTHALMFTRYGACGAAWYMEGLAELLGTHRLLDGRLTLGYFPSDAKTLPFWDRMQLVRDAVRAGKPLSIAEVMAYPTNEELDNEAYGWCWAIATFLDGHPRYRERFRQLLDELDGADFNREFLSLFADDWRELNVEWRAFTHELDFGYDLIRNAIQFRHAEPLAETGATVVVAADRGWQSTGIQVEPDMIYETTATGRYQVANLPKIWWCESGGVTMRYYRGRPLGMLLALLLTDDVDETSWPQPVALGLHGELVAHRPGTLYLRINDAPGELTDNAGSLEVRVRMNGNTHQRRTRD